MKLQVLFSLALIGMATSLSAAPTIEGVDAITVGDSQVYTDSNDGKVLWVTPPTTGTLTVNQKDSLFADPQTCGDAAETIKQRLAIQTTITRLESELLQGYSELGTEGSSITVEILTQRENTIDALLKRLDNRKLDESWFEGAGSYSYVASSGMAEILDEVRRLNPGRPTVNTINTRIVGVVPSLSNGTDTRIGSDYIRQVGIQNFGNLASSVDEVQVDVEITKLGACYLKLPEIMSTNVEPFKFGFSLNYEYPFLFAQRIKAEYQLRRTYEIIQSVRKKKRLFSSSTHTSVLESTDLESELSVEVISDQPLAQEVRFKLEAQAREIVLNVAVTEMIGKLKEAGEVPPSGAQVAADELAKACGPNPYCQGAGAALRILDSIFGNSSQSSSLLQKLEHDVKYDSVSGETLPVLRSISYVAQ